MKVKLAVSGKRYTEIENELAAKGIEIDEEADLVISEKDSFADCLIGKRNGEFFRIRVCDIVYIESFSHDIILHSVNGDYKISERLRQLENMLDPAFFLRISNSAIISREKVNRIKPTMSVKYILTMADGSEVDVTRSYYYIFRETFGI
jgi:DNA-binding LytR/AlgR family response regulator